MKLTPRDIRILQLVHLRKSMQEIADDFKLTKSWVQIQMGRLEDAGYVHNPFKTNRYKKGQARSLTKEGTDALKQEGVLKESNGQR